MATDDSTLVLWSNSYPYDVRSEKNFLEGELRALSAEFDRIILVPWYAGGGRADVPDNVEIDESYARDFASLGRIRMTMESLRPVLVEELVRRPAAAASASKRLVAYAGMAEHARRWAVRFTERRRLNPARAVFYTYWWTHATLGFVLAKERLKGLRVATRAHGHDLYEERHAPAYIPFRTPALRRLDGLFPVSSIGVSYVIERYRARPGLLETARLGVEDPGGTAAPSNDGVLRIVSCSFMGAVKRLERLALALEWAGKNRPEQRIEWTHVGDGLLRDDIEKRMRALPRSVRARVVPYTTRRELLRRYIDEPVDVFANVSESEGVSVAIMEAISCGVPVLATAVGGNPEIATPENGVLVGASPSPEEIGKALFRFIDEPGEVRAWRLASRRIWSERYDGPRNHRDFARRMRSLIR